MDSSIVFATLRQRAPHVTYASLSHPSAQPNSISIGSAVFAQLTAVCRYALQQGSPFPP